MDRIAETPSLAQQLELFAGLVVPEVPPQRRKWKRRARNPDPRQFAVQLELREQEPIDPDEIPEPGDFPAHCIVSAAECAPVKTRAPRSIFDFASEFAAAEVISEFMLARSAPPIHDQTPPADPIHRRIIREAGVTRHIGLRHQETDEWAEKERARRARQKLPKPPKQSFRLRSKAEV